MKISIKNKEEEQKKPLEYIISP